MTLEALYMLFVVAVGYRRHNRIRKVMKHAIVELGLHTNMCIHVYMHKHIYDS